MTRPPDERAARSEPRPLAYRFAAGVIRPVMQLTTRRDWRGVQNIPQRGPCIVVVNHLSDFDFPMVAHVVHDRGRHVRFLAKASLFDIPLVGRIIGAAGMIPVFRGSRQAGDALRSAVAAVESGQLVVIYPEGTITQDPQLWPMRGKTGAARIALETGCPVIPMAIWGPQDILRRGVRGFHLLPPKTIRVLVGEPVDLTGYADRDWRTSSAVLQEATRAIMGTISGLLGEIRHATPPATLYDPATKSGGSANG